MWKHTQSSSPQAWINTIENFQFLQLLKYLGHHSNSYSPNSCQLSLYCSRVYKWQCFQTQFSSVAQSCPNLCDPMDCSTPGLPVHHQLLELTQTHAIQPSHPLSFPSPAFRVFSNESVLPIRWPKYWSFSFSISPSNEYSELISFRMDWLHLLAVQGTLRSLLQHHSSKAPILWHSAFFIVQLSHPYITTGKIIALSSWILSAK